MNTVLKVKEMEAKELKDLFNNDYKGFKHLLLGSFLGYDNWQAVRRLCEEGSFEEALAIWKANVRAERPQPRTSIDYVPMNISKKQVQEMKNRATVDGVLQDEISLWKQVISEVMGIQLDDIETEAAIYIYGVITAPNNQKMRDKASEIGVSFQ